MIFPLRVAGRVMRPKVRLRTLIAAFGISFTSTLALSFEIPTTPAGSWTASGVTSGTIAGGSAAETGTYFKTTPSGLRMTVTVDGAFPNGTSGAYFAAPGPGTSTTGLNPSAAGTNPGVFTTTPVLPSGTNPINLLVSSNPCQTSFPTVTTCSGLGTVRVTLTDPTGGVVPVVAPKIHVTRLGGTVGSMPLATGLQINAAGSTSGIGFAATASATATLSVTGGNEFFGNPSVAGSSLNVNCGATATSTSGCGTVQVTGNAAIIQMNVKSYRTNVSPDAWTNGGDAFFFDMSFDEDFGGAPATYEGGGTAAGHLVTDLRLGATVSVDNATTANGSATGTGLLSASPNAVTAPAAAGDTNDAVASFPPLLTSNIGATYSVTPIISGASRAGVLCGWIDFDRSGTFSAAEGICTPFASGATSAPLNWTVPTATTAGPTYARLRVSYDTAMTTASFNGLFSSGEVEDYLVQIKPVVKVVKAVLPTTDTGTFNLSINGTNFATAIGNNGTTNFKSVYHTDSPDVTAAANVSTAPITGVVLAETAAGATVLSNYGTTSACTNAAGTTVAVAGTAAAPSITIPQSVTGASANGQAQTITCTLTNSKLPTIQITKISTGSVGPFTFSGNNGFVGQTITTTTSGVGVSGAVQTLAAPSTITTITEAIPPGYVLSSINCTGTGTGNTTTNLAAGSVQINALGTAPARTVNCTFTNVGPPKLTLTKNLVTTGGGVATIAGFPLTASGPTTITGVSGAATVTSATVLPGTYTLSETNVADYTAGAWSCTAGTLTGSSLVLASGDTAACSITNTFVPKPKLTVAKSAGAPTTALGAVTTATDALDTITYSYVVNNTGNVTMTGVAPVDAGPKFNGIAGTNALSAFTPATATIAPGGAQTFTATYILSQTDVNNGAGVTNGVTNSATVTGKDPSGGTFTSPASTATATIAKTSSLTMAKSAGAPTISNGASTTLTDGGDTITYTYAVTNSGNVTLTNVVPTDAGPKFNGVTGTGTLGAYVPTTATIAPGATQNFTATYTLTQADVNNAAGISNAITNSATAAGKQPDGTTTTSPAGTATATIAKTSSLTTSKSAAAPTIANGALNTVTDGGDKITYSYTVTNTGNVTLSTVVPTDAGPKFNGITGTGTLGAYAPASATIAPGGSTIFTATYTLSQADVNNAAGISNAVTNSATASGKQPDGSTTTSPTSSATATIAKTSTLATAKSAASPTINLGAVSTATDALDTITYTYVVTNTGNVTLTNVVPSDAGPKFNGINGTNTLGVYTPATASLAPGASQSFTATYALSQTDVNNGAGVAAGVTNAATASGIQPDGTTTTSPSSSANTTIAKASSLTTAKSAGTPTINLGAIATATDALDTITYSYTVTNTGNVTLTNVVPVDSGPKFNGIAGAGTLGAYSPLSSTLAPGGSVIFTATYVLTQTDVNNGAGITNGVSNSATTSGKQPDGTTTTSPTSNATTTIAKASSLTTSKSAGTPTIVNGAVATLTDSGDKITYTYAVTNTGNVTLTNVVPSDAGPKFNGITGTGSLGAYTPATATLAPGATQNFTATYTLSQADVNNAAGITSAVTNSATASGTQPDGATTTSPASNATATIAKTASLTTAKSAGTPTIANGASATLTDGGDTITYSYTVTNTGNVTLTNVVPADAGPKFNGVTGTGTLGAFAPASTTLAPGGSVIFTATYTMTQVDVNNAAGITNGVTNSATTSGKQPDGTTTTSPSSSAAATIPKTSELTASKSAGAPTTALGAVATQTDAGDTITYTYSVTNTGNVTLTNVVPSDAGPKFNGVTGNGTLGAYAPTLATVAPGATQSFTAVYTLTQTDVNNAAGLTNAVTNTATVSGKQPDGTTTTSPSTSATATIAKTAALTTAKSAAAPTVALGASTTATDVGDSITYSYTVTNTGNVTMTNVVPSDAGPKFNGVAGTGTLGTYSPTSATLAPGGSVIFTAIYPLTLTDINNAAGISNGVTNAATSSGNQPDGTTVISPSSSASTTIAEASTLTTSKAATAPTVNLGASATATDGLDTITYTYTVTNTGNVTLTNVLPVDAGPTFNGSAASGTLSGFTPASATLTPGANQVFTATYTLSQGDVNNTAGVMNGVANSATSKGTQPDGGTTTSSASTATTTINKLSSMITLKSAAAPTVALGASATVTDANDTITFSYTVTNTGNVSLFGVVPVDAGPTFNGNAAVSTLSAYTPASATLLPGASQTFTATYTLAQLDIDHAAGITNGVTNTATASGTQPGGGTTVSPSSTGQTTLPKSSTLTVLKAAGAPTVALGASATQTGTGDTITYSYTVKNTGNVSLTNVVPTDAGPTFNGVAKAGTLGAFTPASATLAPGATQIFTAVYTLAQADVNNAAGITNAVSNTAAATGTQPGGATTTAPTSTATTTIPETSTLSLIKSAGAPGIALGVINTATDGGDKITYTYTVKNTGNVTLTNVAPSDGGPTFNSVSGTGTLGAFSPASATLAPGATAIFTAVYTFSQADVNNAAGIANAVANTASATGTKPSGATVNAPNATAQATISATSNVTLSKTASAPTTNLGVLATKTDGGDKVSYTYAVKNTGNVTLTGVVPQDPGPTFNGIAGTGTLAAYTPATSTLAPNATQIFTATYTLSQTDVDNAAGVSNAVSNTATAKGTRPDGATTTSPSATAKTTIASGPAMLVTKTSDKVSVSALPSTITYTITVANTGNVTLTAVNLTDALTQGAALTLTSGPTLNSGDTNTNSKIDVNEIWSYTATYVVTQSNIDSGASIVNAATVTTAQTAPQTASTTTTINQTSVVSMVKTVDSVTTANGASATATDGLDVITYNYVVTNGGNVTLTNVAPTDTGPTFNGVAGTATLSSFTPATATITPGSSQTFTATYVLSQTDVNNAVGITDAVSNTATATGTKPDNTTITSAGSTAKATFANTSSITLVKAGTLNAGANGRADAGDTVSYTFTIKNTGNTTLSNVTVTDAVVAVTVSGGPLTLAPGAADSTSITGIYTLTQADIDAGTFANTATVNGKDPRNTTVSATNGTSVPLAAASALTIDKTTTSSSYTTLGDNIFYNYVVTNSGNTTITSPITVTDNKITTPNTVNCDPWPVAGLAPAATYNCTATYIVMQADIDAGSLTNVASATDGTTTSPTDTVTVPAIKTPKISMVKTARTPIAFSAPGNVITYDYVISNDGNTTITTPVTVSDNFIPSVSCPTVAPGWPVGGLLPGNSVICVGTYTVTQDDLDIGSVTNVASATDGTTTTPTTSATIPANAQPALTLTKTRVDTTFAALGQIVSYDFDIQNTGNVTFTKQIEIVDDQIGTFNCGPVANLTVGSHRLCTATYTITQADLDRGFVTNVAYAKTTFGILVPPTPVTSSTANETIPADASVVSALQIKKTATSAPPPGPPAVGDTLTYTFETTNTGKKTLTNIVITDPLIPSLSCTIPTLLPTAVNNSCQGTYVVTQTDVDAGSRINTATANGVDPQGNNVTATDTLITPTVNSAPSLQLTKTPSLASFDAPGQVIGYVFAVKNTGNVTLTNVQIVDPLISVPPTAPICTIASIAPGATDSTCSASYTTTLADVNAGARANTATATGTPPTGADVTDTGSASVPATQTPQLTLTKSGTLNLGVVGSNARADVGDTITYTFTVKNTGNVTLTNIGVTDPLVTISGAAITLQPGDLDTTTFTGTYTLTQIDINNGVRPNTATTTGTLPDNVTTVSDSASTSSTLNADPKLALTKTGTVNDVNGNGVTDIGDTITYVFTVENTGNVTLINVLVTDPLVTVSGAAIASMAPGDLNTTQFTATYALTQADIDAGTRTNTAAVTGKPPVGTNTTAAATETKTLANAPSITLAKAGTLNNGGDGRADVGDVITYAFTVKNTGNVTLNNVAVTDPLVTVAGGPILSLAPGATNATTFTATYALTQTDIDAGTVHNDANVSGKPPTGADVTNAGSADTALPSSPAIALIKNSVLNDGGDGRADAGDTVNYTFTVTNTGNVTLTNVVVSDPLATVAGGPIASLAVGAVDSTTFSATYTLTQTDVNAGQVVNNASVSGKPPTGANVTGPASKTTLLPAGPGLTLAKAGVVNSGANGVADVGETITYSFTVKNIGNVTLTNVAVSDPLVTVAGGPIATLAPAATDSTTFTATYTLTQTDIDNGQVPNTATVSGKPPTGPNTTAPGTTTTPLPAEPKLALAKVGTLNDGGDGIANVGDTISYIFTVSNSGNVTLTNVKVTDPLLPALGTNPLCAIASLAPAATNSACTATYTLTQADVDAGTVVNTATVTGKPPTGPDLSTPATETTPLSSSPAMTFSKLGTLDPGPDGRADAGDTIAYAFTVKNTGNVTLTNITVADPLVTVSGGPLATLAVGATDITTFTATYVLKQADINAGTFVNTAIVSANPPTGPPITLPASNTTPLSADKGLQLTKTGTVNLGPDGIANVGDIISYAFKVENTGNVTLANVVVTDLTVTVTGGPIASLAPGAIDTTTYQATHILTQADIDAGTYANTANASGNPPTGPPVTTTGSVAKPIAPTPGISLVKSGVLNDGGDGVANVGDVVIYSFTVKNTGNVTLTNVVVTDPTATMSGTAIPSLAPGASDTTTFTAQYTLTLLDVNAGQILNTATADGTNPDLTHVTSPDTVTVSLAPNPSISLLKVGTLNPGGDGVANIGDTISYVFTVQNTGNVTLSNITITDPLAAVTGGPIATLAPGVSDATTFTAIYTLTSADVDAGTVVNNASVKGKPPVGPDVTGPATANNPLTSQPSLTLVKSGTLVPGADGRADAGDVINYTFTVTNTGNVTLTNVTLTDPGAAITGGPIASLAAGAVDTLTFTGSHVLTAVEVASGKYDNTATVSGTPPSGADVSTTGATSVPLAADPTITLSKLGTLHDGGDGVANVGDTITYAFTVTNTGNVPLTGVTINDPLTGAVSGGPITLAAGATDTTTFSATYTLNAADVNLGKVDNAASVKGTPPIGADATANATTTNNLPSQPAITLTKFGTVNTGPDGVANIGDIVTYAFTVKNTGNVTLTNVAVSDAIVTVSGGPITLAAGAQDTSTFTATYTLTATDIDLGKVDNTASASGKPPTGADVSSPASTSTPLASAPAMTLTKAGTLNDGGDGVANIGDTITYAFTVNNTGNVTLTDVVVTDPLVTVSGGPITSLAAGATNATTFTATYTLTAADVNAGKVDNSALVTGKPPTGANVTAPGSTSTPLASSPGITLAKVGTLRDGGDGVANIGDTITYAFTIKNTGNVELTNITLTDPKVAVSGGPLPVLVAGATDSTTFTATYVLTAADVDLGKVDNTANVTGKPPTGADVVATGPTSTPLATSPALQLTKLGTVNPGPDGIANIGDTVTYVFTVKNTGNVTLTNVKVSDPKVTVAGGPIVSLAAGATDTSTFTATYTLLATDVDAGAVPNTATVTGTPPTGADVTAPGTTNTLLPASPSLTLAKAGVLDTGADGIANAGDVINYTFTVQNTGNVTLTNVKVTDSKVTVLGGPIANLNAGATDSATFTATYILTPADVNAGKVDNTADATGTPPTGADVTATGATSTPIAQLPSLSLLKAGVLADGGDGFANIGDVINYTFTVTNTGNVAMSNVTISDPMVTVTGGPLGSLPAGAIDTTTFKATYILKATDVDAGKVDNSATVSGTPPTGPVVTAPGSTSTPLTPSPGVEFTKLGSVNPGPDGVANVGDTISYVFTVKNTGNVSLNNVTVSDPKVTVSGGPLANLTAGATDTTTFTATYILKAIDIDAGKVDNTATVSAKTPAGVDVTTPASTTTPLIAQAAIALVKASVFNDESGDGFGQVGETISYTFSVKNTGNVTLTNVIVSDPLVTVTGGPLATLAAGATDSTTFKATKTITAADITAGKFTNSASVTGTPPTGADVNDTSDSANPADGTLPGNFGSGVGSDDPTVVPLLTKPIVATADNAIVPDGANATPNVLNVLTGDTLGGTAATTGTVTITVASGSSVPPQLTFDPSTGIVGVNAATPAGTYSFDYTICETANPTNCATATATVKVNPPATISGVVFVDENGNGALDSGEPKASGYGVRIVDSGGNVVGTAITDANGAYNIDVPAGAAYTIIFSLPGGGPDVGSITTPVLAPGAFVVDQNLPIDPSGVVYDAVTRLPVAGVTVTLTDAGGAPLPAACLGAGQQNQVTDITGAYRFDILPGAAAQCPVGQTEYRLQIVNPAGYLPGYASSIPPLAGPLSVAACPIDPIPGGSCQVSPSAVQPPVGTPGVYYTSFLIASGDADLVNNHLPIQPVPTLPATFSKKADVSTAQRGDTITYTIEANNVAINPARIVDVMPAGFNFVTGSATANGVAVTPTANGNSLTFDGLVPNATSSIVLKLKLVVGSNVVPGPQTNNAQFIDPATGAVIATARAVVEVLPEHVFDCGDIIGKVFDDKNRNGYQDDGEPGLPGVRVVTVKGLLITTDDHGRFHIGCADVPDADIGSNFLLKLDTRTLPTGYRVTTENPRTVRLTRGKVTKLNFGASISRVIRLDMTAKMFTQDDGTSSKLAGVVQQLIAILDKEPSTLRLTYYTKGEGADIVRKRISAVQDMVNEQWSKRSGRYKLPVETRIVGVK